MDATTALKGLTKFFARTEAFLKKKKKDESLDEDDCAVILGEWRDWCRPIKEADFSTMTSFWVAWGNQKTIFESYADPSTLRMTQTCIEQAVNDIF